MPFKKGDPKPAGSGRSKNQEVKSKKRVRERLEDLGCDIVEYLALTVQNRVPCGVCRGRGRTPFQPGAGKDEPRSRPCQSCWGSKLERLKPSERAQAASDLLQYTERKLKSVEHSGEIDIQPSWEVVKPGEK
jgi:hypothetical protein